MNFGAAAIKAYDSHYSAVHFFIPVSLSKPRDLLCHLNCKISTLFLGLPFDEGDQLHGCRGRHLIVHFPFDIEVSL
jgi:hypothetical protein